MEIEFVKATEADVPQLAKLAAQIWGEYWPALIGQGQTDYMIQKYQSEEAILRDMTEHGYEYWFMREVSEDAGEPGNIVGYTGGHDEPETQRFFVSKVYLLNSQRGKGYCSTAVRFYNDLCLERGLRAMYLTVNKHNELGKRAYYGNGFEVIESVKNDIGCGFYMDDYIMERPVQ